MHGNAPEAGERIAPGLDGGKKGGVIHGGARFFIQHVFEPLSHIGEGCKLRTAALAQRIQDRVGKALRALWRTLFRNGGFDFCGDIFWHSASHGTQIAQADRFPQGGGARKARFRVDAGRVMGCARAGDGDGRNARRKRPERFQVFKGKDVVGCGKGFRFARLGERFGVCFGARCRKGKAAFEVEGNAL